jgi:hypothetical protein
MVYTAVVRLLFNRHFVERYRAISDRIPAGAEVVDVCAGDCYLYRRFLKEKHVRYIGLDLSSPFVKWACGRGIRALQFDLWKNEIPEADYVVMQSSLYQFIPREKWVIAKLLKAARKTAVVSEPVRNLSSSNIRWVADLSRILTRPMGGASSYRGQRFNPSSLSELFHSFPEFQKSCLIPGGREMLGIFQTSTIPPHSDMP